jgi:hypothetical protein
MLQALFTVAPTALQHGGARVRAPPTSRCTHATMVAERRVVVTGMGLVSCIGSTPEEVTESLYEAKSGLSYSQEFADAGMKSQVTGAPVTFDCDALIDRKQRRFMGQNAKYAFVAMQKAIEDSGLTPEQIQSPRVAGILGQADTSAADLEDVVNAVRGQKRVQSKVGPYRITRTMGSSISAVLSTHFKLQGTSYAISSACSSARPTSTLLAPLSCLCSLRLLAISARVRMFCRTAPCAVCVCHLLVRVCVCVSFAPSSVHASRRVHA